MVERENPYLLPIAILIAGALLAVAIYIVRVSEPVSPLESVGAIRPVSPDDHMFGNPDAPVIIVEYSDIDCAYCKEFQETLTQLMTEYAPTGKVAWAYRHFPVINLHPNADEHAEAAECVGELGGDALFFSFINMLHQATPGADEFNPSGYNSVVEALELDVTKFTECRESDRHVERVTLDFENAVDGGGAAAPYTVIFVRGGAPIPITGSLPYEAMKEIIETAIANVVE